MIVFASVVIFAIILSSTCIIIRQQQTIESLTDKLMVRQGHREYRQEPLMQEEKPTRKPMSYYDDPSIDDVAN